MDPAKEIGALAAEDQGRARGLRRLRSRIGDLRFHPRGMAAVKGWRILIAPGEYVRRRAAARAALRDAPPRARLDERLGYGLFGPGELDGTAALLRHCSRVFDELAPHLADIQGVHVGSRRVTVDLFSDDRLRDEPVFVDFALQDSVLLPVVQYLRTVPFLARLVLGVSLHCPELYEPTYHQRFHVDNDDFRQVKLFLNAGDVASGDGPLCFLPADASARALRGLRREGRRIGRATITEVRQMLTFCLRGERFSEGHWEAMIENGGLRTLLERLLQLRG